MFRSLKNLSLFQRFIFAFLFAAVVSGAIIFTGYFSYSNIMSSYGSAQQQDGDMLVYLRKVQTDLTSLHQLSAAVASNPHSSKASQLQYSFVTDKPAVASEIESIGSKYSLSNGSEVGSLRGDLQAAKADGLVQDQETRLNDLVNNSWPAYSSAADQIAGHTDANGNVDLLAGYQNAEQSYLEVTKGLSDLTSNAMSINSQIDQYREQQVQQLGYIMIGITALLMLIVFFIGLRTARVIIRPLAQLELWTRRIAGEDFNIRAPVMGISEIDLVSQSMNAMLDRTVFLMQKAQEEHASLQNQVEQILQEVSNVGDGDLSVRASDLPGSMGVLSTSFNYMIEELSDLIIHVQQVAAEVGRLTTVVLEHMATLVRTNAMQTQLMGVASVEMESMSRLSRVVAERAQLLQQMSITALHSAQSGRLAMGQVVDGMNRIQGNVLETVSKVNQLGERSREINEAVKVISEIAHQTNKFALDASIQAALAGKEGQAFSVVAADIRRLSERASDQSASISRTAQRIQEEIEVAGRSVYVMEQEAMRNVPITHKAGTSLESIFAGIEHEALEIEHIALMAEQQQQAATTIVTIIQALARDTLHSSTATVQSMSDETKFLAPLVQKLRQSIDAFRLRGKGSQPASFTPLASSVSPQIAAQAGQSDQWGPLPGRPLSSSPYHPQKPSHQV